MDSGTVTEVALASVMSALETQKEGLLASLRSGGIGALALAESLNQTALGITSQVEWGAEPTDEDWGAGRDGPNLVVMAGSRSVSLCERPKILTLSQREPTFESLALSWSEAGSLSVEWFTQDSEQSWTISGGGTCLSDSDIVSGLEQRIGVLEDRDMTVQDRPSPGLPRPDSDLSDWLGDFASVLPGLSKMATETLIRKAAAKSAEPKAREPVGTACAGCGKECPPEAVFCPFCGNKMESKSTCKECGAELLEDAKFCAQCGTKVAQEPALCSCGRTFQEGEAFCPKCGEQRA